MTEQQKLLSISELATRHGITHRALRFYESKGLLSPTRSGGAGKGFDRHYTESDADKVALILRAKSLGFTIEEAKEIIVSDGEGSWRIEVSRERASAQLGLMAERLTQTEIAVDWLRAVANGEGRAAA